MAVEELGLVISNPTEGNFLKQIGWNKTEIMELVSGAVKFYENIAYTDEDMKDAKADRAKLNNMKKAISARRIEIKKAVMAPYDQFEAEVKEVVALIDKPIELIDAQIKAYEDKQKADKKQKLIDFFEQNNEHSFVTFDMVFDSRYLNVSVSLKKATDDIRQKLERVATDIRSLEAFASEKYRSVAMDVYTKTLNLGEALAEDKRLIEIDRKIEKEILRKKEEEDRRKEAEALKAVKAAEIVQPVVQTADEKDSDVDDTATVKRNCKGCMGAEHDDCKHCDVNSKKDGNVHDPSEDAHYEPENVQKSIENAQNQQKMYRASFMIRGTYEQIMAVKQFMIDNGIQFGKVE